MRAVEQTHPFFSDVIFGLRNMNFSAQNFFRLIRTENLFLYLSAIASSLDRDFTGSARALVASSTAKVFPTRHELSADLTT
ncbi:hypothetical protein E2P81_ATG00415 [Venturia nashicola]|nr:hypothetical protein E2P81_ATG00415 [Venturia nashicola]